MKKAKEKLIIIDGNALIHRSFHALPETMKTKDGQMVNAAYGFTSFLLKAWLDIKPTYIVLTLDEKGPTFRHEEYVDYKATRIKAPDELYEQIPMVREIAAAFNIPVFSESGFEADDVIGTICRKVDGEIEKIIITGDLDTLQLINNHTKVYTMSRGFSDSVLYGEKEVIERFGLKPEQMIDYKALRGDPSDNIPGIKGIGEKGAIELLKSFKTLDNLYQNLDSPKIKPRIKGLLQEQKKEAYLSQHLATIKTDLKIKFKLKDTIAADLDKAKVFNILNHFEFRSLLPKAEAILNNFSETKETQAEEDKFSRNQKEFNYNLIDNENDFDKFLIELKKQKLFVFDTETTGLDPLTAQLLGISFSWQSGLAYYLKLTTANNNLFNYQEQDNPFLKKLAPIFSDPKIKKCGHNLKFDIRVLKQSGLKVEGLYFDSMIASYLLNPDNRQHGLDALAQSEFGFNKISTEELLGKGKEKINFSEVPIEKLYPYSCEDADFSFRLYESLSKKIKKLKLEKLMTEIEIPLIPVLAQMEDEGVLIDMAILKKQGQTLRQKVVKLEEEIHKLAGTEFNINSPKQLQEILFEKLAIPTKEIKKTKTGLSTASDELDKIKSLHPIIVLIQEHRELSKLINTYIEALPELINKNTKRVHTNFNQTIAATGRLSSNNPNLQNIPTRSEEGKKIREAFIAPAGYKILSLDYSQIELRLAAHLSNDKKMIKAFLNNIDIHQATAAEINQVKLEDVSSLMRYRAKAVNFGILYGQGPHGLSQNANISYNEARDFIARYFSAYQGIKKYLEEKIEEAKKHGYVNTLFDRRRYLPDINSDMMQIRRAAERMAINAPIQGTAADMIKLAMIEINQLIKDKKDIKMIIQVHDELIFEVKAEKAEVYADKIKKIMEEVISLKVPIIVDASIADNWGEIK